MTDHATQQAAAQYESICEMIAAANLDWDRLEELRDLRADHECDMADETDPKPFNIACPDESEELAELEETAGNCADYEEAMQRIYESPLSVEFRSGWSSDPQDLQVEEFQILLCTGGPAVRIMGELGFDGEPARAWLEYQDWGTPWTQYFDASQDVLIDFARWNISL